MTGAAFQGLINKRHTLNALIQGVALCRMLDGHQLVHREMEHLHPRVYRAYDRLAMLCTYTQWFGKLAWPKKGKRFWSTFDDPDHLMHGHRFFARHGGTLARAGEIHVRERLHAHGFRTSYLRFHLQFIKAFCHVAWIECTHEDRLTSLATLAAARYWGIDRPRLSAKLTPKCSVGPVPPPLTKFGRKLTRTAVGWSHVVRADDGQLGIEAKASFWTVLVHEVVKGVAEMICLRGFDRLDGGDYAQLIHATDRVDFEPWSLQAGFDLWRRLADVMDPRHTHAEHLMFIAQMNPDHLDELMFALIEDPPKARRILGDLMDAYIEPEPWSPPRT
ncbi:MAG: hypothetical protein AAGI54_08860 [Planctomycetota bacterium]